MGNRCKGSGGRMEIWGGFYNYLLHISAHTTLGLLFELWQSEKQVLQYYGEVLHAFMVTCFYACYRRVTFLNYY